MRMERRGNGFANIIKREICLGQLAYNGRRQISSQYVNLLHTCKHPKIRGYWNRQNHNWFKKFFFFKCKISLLASLLFTPVILPTNVAFLFFQSGVGLFCFLSRKSFAILTENKWAFECTWSPLAINQAKRPPQHFMRKLYLYSINIARIANAVQVTIWL